MAIIWTFHPVKLTVMVASSNILIKLIDTLSTSTDPHAVLALRATEAQEERMDQLVAKKEAGTLTQSEALELHEYLLEEELVGIAKARALQKLAA